MGTKQDWTPVRDGDIYCSPACGAGCTFKAWEEAQAKSKAMADDLGPGWTPNVWENLGWYCGARAAGGNVRVYPNRDGSFSAYFDIYRGNTY
jgi:hypothetical protein